MRSASSSVGSVLSSSGDLLLAMKMGKGSKVRQAGVVINRLLTNALARVAHQGTHHQVVVAARAAREHAQAHRLVVARQLALAGYASEFCIDTTVRRAAGLGLAVTLASDAHTTHDKTHASAATISAHHNATLPAMSSFGVRIQAVATAELCGQQSVGLA